MVGNVPGNKPPQRRSSRTPAQVFNNNNNYKAPIPICVPDKTYVAPKYIPVKLDAGVQTHSVDASNGNWKEMYANYKPKDVAKYNKVKNYIAKGAESQGNHSADPKAIANMICSLCDNYGIDPEIIAKMLNIESGGYVFTPKVMSDRKKYKGVMQVDMTMVKILYAKPDAQGDAYEYDNYMHGKYDRARIDELKKKYPTPESMWKAIQTDVSLGLEIGIMAYKIKLSSNKGDCVKAFRAYCAGQYSFPDSTTVTRKYNPIPTYQRA